MLVDAGIVDDDIERPALRHVRLHHARVADIKADRGRADLPGKTGCRFDIEVSDHNVSTGIGKATNDRRTNTLRAARDEGAAAIEPPESARGCGWH
jgi:hypothetical protein